MNMPCGGNFEKNFNLSGMTLSDLHYTKERILKNIKESVVDNDKHYNEEKKETSIKMK